MSSQITHCTTDEICDQFGNRASKLIDVRSVDAYNGWKLRNEPRGGHIEGARSLPAKWINYIDWIEIVRSKEISPQDSLILYGYESDITEIVARNFIKAGYQNVSIYDHFVDEWSANRDLPMRHLARFRHLVSSEWLNELITSGDAPEYDNNTYVICHAHYRNRSDYEEGHIPGAIALDTNTLESPETWNRRTPDELKGVLEGLGITHGTSVILYGRFSNPNNDDPFPGSSAGQLAAMRCAFIMMYAGVEDVRILNGGLRSWLDEGYSTTTDEPKIHPVADFGSGIPSCPKLAVDLPEAKSILQSPGENLVSVRSWEEYIGEVSGYNYIEKKGRIPGAVFGNCGSDAYHMENYRNLDHTTREDQEIETMLTEVGITSDKRNSFYCGTGWRASEAFFNVWLMGWPRVSVFDGGWFEWSNEENNPIETGVPG